MWVKILQEKGDYIDAEGNDVNMLTAIQWVDTPEGRNAGWIEVDSVEEAETMFNLKKVIKEGGFKDETVE